MPEVRESVADRRGLISARGALRLRRVSETLNQSPLEAVHLELGGRMVPFAGWSMPVMYSSILDEHRAVRGGVGVFDISHMGQFFVRGSRAGEALEGLLTNRIAKLGDGEGQYTLMLNEAGGVIDDLIVYRLGAEEYFLVVNAAKLDEDREWLAARLGEGARLDDESANWAALAVQGPRAGEMLAPLHPGEELPPRNGIRRLADGSIVCRTGYTGEDGFEYFCAVEEGVGRLRALLEAGAAPCGLGARDSLRLEAGFPLNGNDLSPERTPLEAGLGIFVDLDKGDFVGREPLARQKAEGLERRLVALACTAKGAPPRAHYPVLDADGEVVGELSSGGLSPTLGRGIGLAYLPLALAKRGTALQLDVRGRRVPMEVVKKPFYKRPQAKA